MTPFLLLSNEHIKVFLGNTLPFDLHSIYSNRYSFLHDFYKPFIVELDGYMGIIL